jgi:hypothetical protein
MMMLLKLAWMYTRPSGSTRTLRFLAFVAFLPLAILYQFENIAD